MVLRHSYVYTHKGLHKFFYALYSKTKTTFKPNIHDTATRKTQKKTQNKQHNTQNNKRGSSITTVIVAAFIAYTHTENVIPFFFLYYEFYYIMLLNTLSA